MSSTHIKDAHRIMGVCNACRYCEGFCAVFPAMELRRTFTPADLKYLANLCHNCRGCYYACQYAPPHEFALNVPKTLAELRQETYGEFTWPTPAKGLFFKNGRRVTFAALAIVAVALVMAFIVNGSDGMFATHSGAGAFYKIISYSAMVVPFSALALYILFTFFKCFGNFWRETGGTIAELRNPRNHLRAIWDVLQLKYLDGGGHGCNYPDDRFSMVRRYFHHATFYGFMSCFAATTIAAFYDHFLHLPAPYPIFSWPVLLGSMGGIALLIGTGGLLYLKWQMDRAPAAPEILGMDVAFTTLLFMTSLTGMLLLLLRATPLMGILLVVHLAAVAGLFITMPYGKFLHALYRYAALVKNAAEQANEKEQ